MDALTFVDKLNELAPLKTELESKGFSAFQIEMSLGRYILTPKQSFLDTGNQILNLSFNFNVSFLSIGLLDFKNEVKTMGEFTHFASYSVNPVCIDNKSGNIVELVEDNFEEYDLLNLCAVDDSAFLDSLFAAIKFLERKNKNAMETNVSLINEYVMQCVRLSKSEESVVFYNKLLGGDLDSE